MREKFPFVIRIKFSDGSTGYYNGVHFILVKDPDNASGYATIESTQKYVDHAGSNGGEVDVCTYEEARIDYNKIYENN